MKRRYGKLFAYFFFGCATGCVLYPLGTIMMLFSPVGNGSLIAVYIGLSIGSILLTILMSKRLFRGVPKEERAGTFFRCWKLGFKIAFKIALCLTVILFAKGMGINTDISERDMYEPHWYDDRRKVKANGIECKVGRSGDYIEMENKWVRVNRASNGDPYIEKDGEKIWLE